MRTKINASVGIKNTHGVLEFGTALWIDGNVLMIQSEGYMKPGTNCEIKLELAPAGGWIYSQAQIIHASPYAEEQQTRAVVRMLDLNARDQERLETYADIHHQHCLPRRAPTLGISTTGTARPPADDPTVHIRDPQFQLSDDERRLTVRWQNARTYRQDWAMHLAHGRLPAQCPRPLRRAFMLRLVLPTGFVASFPAEVGEKTHEGWNARFFIPVPARRRMEAIAQVGQRSIISAK